MMQDVRLGKATADITPPFAVPLAGFAGRANAHEGTSRRLYVRVWLFAQEDSRGATRHKLLVQADLIWWGSERMPALYRMLGEKWGLRPEDVIFHGSHTHGGPQTTDRLNSAVGELHPAYMRFLETKVEEAVAEAFGNVEPVTIELGKGACEGIGINRRLQVDGVTGMAPNPDGVNDTELIVVRFRTTGQAVKGVWFHFTCHPTTTGDNKVTSEYCGAAMERLDAELGAGTSCFLQGFCGDIRPALIRDGQFYRGDDADVGRNGAILAQAVLDILGRPLERIEPAELASWTRRVELRYASVPQEAEWRPQPEDSALEADWKRLMADPERRTPTAPLHFQLLRIADKLQLLAVDGEVVVEYGLAAKALSGGRVLPLGYCNGMLGYIPTARQLEEGGYESVGSFKLFGYPSPFAPEVELTVRTAIEELIRETLVLSD